MTAGSRREALGGAAVLAALPLLVRVRSAFAQAEGDASILRKALELEQIAVFTYTAAVESGVLDEDTLEVAKLFRDQEQAHVDALASSLEALGGSRPPIPANGREFDKAVAGLGIETGLATLKDQQAILAFAIELESATVAAYHDAHQKLQDAKLLQTAASIMANEGQHLVVLRQAVGAPPVPNAFETGLA